MIYKKILAAVLSFGIYFQTISKSRGEIPIEPRDRFSLRHTETQDWIKQDELYLAFASDGKDSATVFRDADIKIITDYDNLEASVINASREKLDELVNQGQLEFYVRRNGSTENERFFPSYIGVVEDDQDKPEDLSLEWAHNRVKTAALARYNISGEGIKVGILDTGIDRTVPEFAGMIEVFHDYVYNRGDTVEHAYDDYGHGTFVASIIQRILPDCKFYVYKIHQQSGENKIDDILEAFNAAYADHLDVINNSWGLDSSSELNGMTFDDANKVLEEVIERISTTGTIVVASAGNDSFSGRKSLEHMIDGSPFAISVGASTILDEVADFSDLDGEIFAPGQSVYGTRSNDRKQFWNGTSFSGPFVAAAVGAVIEYSREHNKRYNFQSIKIDLIKSGERQSSIIVTSRSRYTYYFKLLNLERLMHHLSHHS